MTLNSSSTASSCVDWTAKLASIRDLVATPMASVDRTLTQQLHSDAVLVTDIAHHIIHSGGKRLRPLLLLLGADTCDYQGDQHIPMAAAIELIHTATLLHDDVVDRSMQRRGQQTANATFGDDASVLVGDFLYSRAFQIMVAVGNIRIMSIMADTTNVIVEGELLQLLNCHDATTTEARYLQVIHAKTAKLFETTMRIGAVLANHPPVTETAIAEFGRCLGMTYQLVDDLLDYNIAADSIGKSIGDDLAEGQPTLPLIHAIRNANPDDVQIVRHALEHGDRSSIDNVLRIIESTDSIAYTSRLAAFECEQARKALQALPASPYRDALDDIALFALHRSY